VSEPLEVSEVERLALLGGELADRRTAFRFPLPGGGLRLDVAPRRDPLEGIRIVRSARGPRLSRPQPVDRPAPRRNDEPREHAPAGAVERRRGLPRIQEGLLYHLLGFPGVTEDPVSEAEEARRVPVVELPQGVGIARFHRRDQRAVGRIAVAREGAVHESAEG
jgi:hypothetical protein